MNDLMAIDVEDVLVTLRRGQPHLPALDAWQVGFTAQRWYPRSLQVGSRATKALHCRAFVRVSDGT